MASSHVSTCRRVRESERQVNSTPVEVMRDSREALVGGCPWCGSLVEAEPRESAPPGYPVKPGYEFSCIACPFEVWLSERLVTSMAVGQA